MSKKFHPYIAICLLFLFGFSLGESGLHAVLHGDHHDHFTTEQTDDLAIDIHDCPHHNESNSDLSLQAADEICQLCAAFTLNAAFDLWAPDTRSDGLAFSQPTILTQLSWYNSEINQSLTRGPPVV